MTQPQPGDQGDRASGGGETGASEVAASASGHAAFASGSGHAASGSGHAVSGSGHAASASASGSGNGVSASDVAAPSLSDEGGSDLIAAAGLTEACGALRVELAKVIVGQDQVIELVLIALLARGHCLMQGAPGLAKTLLISTLARAMELSFQRIQFTPDLMPSDITGTEVLQEDPQSGRRRFEFVPGPIFANLLLADEINRTPPKTQAALLQAMQEHEVTAGNRTMPLPDPFFVLATQNPIEQEGTYLLPEAQLDRFMFMVHVGYPPREDELRILRRTTGISEPAVCRVISADRILALQRLIRRTPVGDHVFHYVLEIVRATRPNEPHASDFVRQWLKWGAGPRAGQYMILAGKARAMMHGRLHVTLDDIDAVAAPTLRHRIIPSFNADAEGVTVDQIINKILALTPRQSSNRLL